MPDPLNRDADTLVDASTERALNTLHRGYSTALRAYFTKRVPTHTDPDDLVQDVFMRLLARRETRAIEHIEGYIFRIAANVLHDHSRRNAVRHRGAHEPFDEALHGREEISPERAAMGAQTLAVLVAALEELPRRTRTVFVLHRFEGMRHSEISAQLGISTSSVEKHMMKALAHLARAMDRPS